MMMRRKFAVNTTKGCICGIEWKQEQILIISAREKWLLKLSQFKLSQCPKLPVPIWGGFPKDPVKCNLLQRSLVNDLVKPLGNGAAWRRVMAKQLPAVRICGSCHPLYIYKERPCILSICLLQKESNQGKKIKTCWAKRGFFIWFSILKAFFKILCYRKRVRNPC